MRYAAKPKFYRNGETPKFLSVAASYEVEIQSDGQTAAWLLHQMCSVDKLDLFPRLGVWHISIHPGRVRQIKS